MLLISRNYRNVVLVTHQFDAAIKVVIFENSLPLPERRFCRICRVGKDLIILRLALAALHLRQTRCLQDLGINIYFKDISMKNVFMPGLSNNHKSDA